MSRVYRNTRLEAGRRLVIQRTNGSCIFPRSLVGGIVCVAFCLFWRGEDNQSIVCIGRSEVRWRSGIFGSISMESPCKGGKGGGE